MAVGVQCEGNLAVAEQFHHLTSRLARSNEQAGSSPAPTPENRLQRTYTPTGATSPSCDFQGSWTFRADITQSGRDPEVKLWKPNGSSLCDTGGGYEMCQPSFHGQDYPDGVLFVPDSYDTLFVSPDPDVMFLRVQGGSGTGHAVGQYVDGRFEALYDGKVRIMKTASSDRRCYAPNHLPTFVRR